MKIKVVDRRDANEVKSTEHNVAITADLQSSFEFKSDDLLPPALGKNYFVGRKEIT